MSTTRIICPENNCTGCFGCANICPSGCITLKDNLYGELHPVINTDACINCGLCENTCPSNHLPKFNDPNHCYAAWTKDYALRCECASGGLGTLLSRFSIQHYHGVVFGTRYNKELMPVTDASESVEGLNAFKGSKYVQSIVGNKTYKNIKTYLKEGRFVLYIGTPCQIAALNNFLKVDYERLITVDLLCHGVTPTKYFLEEIHYLIKKKHLKNIDNVRFRGNEKNILWPLIRNKVGRNIFSLVTFVYGKMQNNYVLTLWSNTKLMYSDKKNPYYLTGFLNGITLRENCFECNYSRPERVSDITIGDFIGLDKRLLSRYGSDNVSSVTTNTKKGEDFYQKFLAEEKDFISIEREYSERLKYGPSLTRSSLRDPLNAKFKELYVNEGYVSAIRVALKDYMTKLRYKRILNLWTYIYRIPRKVYNVINAKIYRLS